MRIKLKKIHLDLEWYDLPRAVGMVGWHVSRMMISSMKNDLMAWLKKRR